MNKIIKLAYCLLIIYICYLLFEISRKILGGSLGFEELVIGLLIANLGYSFYLGNVMSEHLVWHKASDIKSK